MSDKVRIVVNDIGYGQVFIGDKDISNSIQAITLCARVGHATKVKLHVLASVEVEAVADVTTIADAYQQRRVRHLAEEAWLL